MDYTNYSNKENHHRRNYRPFRRSRNGLIYGVCQGLSNYTGISVGVIRTLAVISLIASGFAPIGVIYILLAIFIPTIN
jgi:phage shock protein PspC (stress-responsive transcriptional regulator)